jgi:ubiquinone/menaquinone biosynthesis C-methylase UbiE
MNANKEIKHDGQAATKIFDDRTVESDYRTLVPLLTKGLRVLDVGCGTGAISKGIANYVGPTGHVTGIDNTEKFIESGKETYKDVHNLTLVHTDLFEFKPEEKYDLIVAARVLQWLSNPKEALKKMREMLKPNGQISILDYNHEAIGWEPAPPASMQKFYSAFLEWRREAGMNNRIADDLSDYFKEAGFTSIEVLNSDELYRKGEPNFNSKVAIWSKVALLTQIVEEGYISDVDRLKAIEEYDHWIETAARSMTMKLNEVRGRRQ